MANLTEETARELIAALNRHSDIMEKLAAPTNTTAGSKNTPPTPKKSAKSSIEHTFGTLIDALGLEPRANDCLKRNNINTIAKLTDLSWLQLQTIDGLYWHDIKDIEERLARLSLSLKKPPIDPSPTATTHIENLDLSNDALYCLQTKHINTLGDITSLTLPEFRGRHSEKAIDEITELVSTLGFSFKELIDPFANLDNPRKTPGLTAEQRATIFLQAIDINPMPEEAPVYGKKEPKDNGYVWLKQIITLIIEALPSAIDIGQKVQEIAIANNVSIQAVKHNMVQSTGINKRLRRNRTKWVLPIDYESGKRTIPQLALIIQKLVEAGKL